MRNIIFAFVLCVILVACETKTPVTVENNPVGDSTSFKLVYDYDVRNDFVEYGDVGFIVLVDFNGNIKYYTKTNGKTLNADITYKIKSNYIKESLLIDTLNNLFTKNNFSGYPINIPYDIDSNSTFQIPFTIQNLAWRKSKSDKFYNVTIYPKPAKGTYTYPNNFEEFFKSLKLMLGFI